MLFRNLAGGKFTLERVVEELYKSVQDYPDNEHKLIIGSDSQRYGSKTNYITVIVLHHVGKCGRMFYMENRLPHSNSIDLSVRIMQETTYTVEILQAIENSILIDLVGRENLSAHIDAGYNGASKKIVDSCIGWINSLGFVCRCKPNAFVASHIADRFTRGK